MISSLCCICHCSLCYHTWYLICVVFVLNVLAFPSYLALLTLMIFKNNNKAPCTTEHSLKYNPLVESITMKSVNIALLNVSHFKTKVNPRSKITHQFKPKVCRNECTKGTNSVNIGLLNVSQFKTKVSRKITHQFTRRSVSTKCVNKRIHKRSQNKLTGNKKYLASQSDE